MKLEALKYLLDIQAAIEDVESFTTELKNFTEYSSNKILKAAVERKLLIIGEAVNKFRVLEVNVLIENADKIYGLRNRLAHSYDSIDDNTIYAIIKNHLQPLKSEINKLLEENYNKK
jgi:uncharacterized protein with HEPN domain